MQKDLAETDKYILSRLTPDWAPPITYQELEDEKFKRPELEEAMAKLIDKLDLVKPNPWGKGFNLTRAGLLIQDESFVKEQEAA